MKIEIDMDEVLESWKTENRNSCIGPSNSTIGQVVSAICDSCHNYYQAASFLIDGAFELLPEKDVSDVLAEHGYGKIKDGTK